MTHEDMLKELALLNGEDSFGNSNEHVYNVLEALINSNQSNSMETAKGNLIATLLESVANQPEVKDNLEHYTDSIIATDDLLTIVAGIGLLKGIAIDPEKEAILIAEFNDATGANIPPYEA